MVQPLEQVEQNSKSLPPRRFPEWNAHTGVFLYLRRCQRSDRRRPPMTPSRWTRCRPQEFLELKKRFFHLKEHKWCPWDSNWVYRMQAVWPYWAIFCFLGKHSKPLATIILPNYFTVPQTTHLKLKRVLNGSFAARWIRLLLSYLDYALHPAALVRIPSTPCMLFHELIDTSIQRPTLNCEN